MKYGLLTYSTINIGDEIQSIAAKQFLPEEISAYFDRDNIDDANIAEKTKLIINGWFTHKPENWPPKNIQLDPLLISFHISNAWGCVSEKLLTQEALEFYRKCGPIGCRDLDTTTLLKEKGIDAYFSGCLTLTLKNNSHERNEKVYIVDIDEKVKKYIPRSIKRKAEYVTHIVPKNKHRDAGYKFFLAQETLDKYAQAKLVITSRLHCALPCLAFGTPVIFIHKNLEDPRFTGYLEYLHHYSVGDIVTERVVIDWESIQKNPKDISAISENIQKTCINFIGENYYNTKREHKEDTPTIKHSPKKYLSFLPFFDT